MTAAAILDFCTIAIIELPIDIDQWNSAVMSSLIGCYQKKIVWPKSTKIINSRWRRPPFWSPFIVHNLVGIARTCTKFHMRAKFDVLHVVMPQNRTKMIFNIATATILYFNTTHNKSAADWKRFINFAGMWLVATDNKSCDHNREK